MKIGDNKAKDTFLAYFCFMGAIDKMISDSFGLTNGATAEYIDNFKTVFYEK